MIQDILKIISTARLDLSDEKRTQADLETVFLNAGIQFEREVRLSKGDIVDFMLGGVALELKLRGASKKAIYRQLCRYAKHPAVTTLVLASNISMGLPPEIDGKPVYYLSLGRAWL